MMSTMSAISVSGHGSVDVLVSTKVLIPAPGPLDILILVRAVSINPVEAKIRAGKWAGGNIPAGSILGFDAAGVVLELGSSVPSGAFKENDEVWFLGSTLPTKSNAEYVLADWRALALKPKKLSFEDSAALPLVGLTAWELAFEQMNIGAEPGAILIINGAGGVGSITLQLAASVKGMKTVVATASRPASIAHVKALGATHTISHRELLVPQIKALGLNEPIKYVLLLTAVTKEMLEEIIEVVAPRASVGLAVQGPSGSYDSFGKAQTKGLTFHWGFVFTRCI